MYAFSLSYRKGACPLLLMASSVTCFVEVILQLSIIENTLTISKLLIEVVFLYKYYYVNNILVIPTVNLIIMTSDDI